MNPDAEKIAAALDRERKEKGPRSPLHGIPILIKDNIDTEDRMMTTAGSLALVGAKPAQRRVHRRESCAMPARSFSVRQTSASGPTSARPSLRAAGAGAADKPEILTRWIAIRAGRAPVRARQSRRILCAAAIGTETDGSIVCPSSANSLVGIKPTVGLVSRAGIIPIAHSQDTAGPMARTVRDAAMILGALTGVDPRDPSDERESRQDAITDYTKFLDKDGLKGVRLGVARKHFGFNERVDKLMNTLLAEMKTTWRGACRSG